MVAALSLFLHVFSQHVDFLTTLLTATDAACCASSSAGNAECGGSPPQECLPMCAAKLIDLQATCPRTMTLFFNLNEMTDIGNFKDLCLETITAPEVLESISALERTGCVLTLDGVALIQVASADDTCTDKGRAELCATVEAGILDCSEEFCNGNHCLHAGQCDSTCGYCTAGRRQVQLLDEIRTSRTCSPLEFSARTAAVDAACCDKGPHSCTDGAPHEVSFLDIQICVFCLTH